MSANLYVIEERPNKLNDSGIPRGWRLSDLQPSKSLSAAREKLAACGNKYWDFRIVRYRRFR
ncbi:MAG TPA: hypothetical protein VM686_10235 [Polyangiaceae bacterium]|jgi:hypothetical protein|nr:hypothetical protein [Polyangiaceae bacterium]